MPHKPTIATSEEDGAVIGEAMSRRSTRIGSQTKMEELQPVLMPRTAKKGTTDDASTEVTSANTPMGNLKRRSLHDLPNELLSRIFFYYTNACDFEDGFQGPPTVSYQARALLCSLDHQMREAAIGSPQLWTSIQVRATPEETIFPSQSLLKLWVKRSGSLLIHVDLYGPYDLTCGHPGDTGSPKRAIAAMQLLRSYIHRWKSFKIFFLDRSAEVFSDLPLQNAENLEEIEVVSSCPQELDDKLLANISKIPALRQVTWDKYILNGEDEISSFQIAVLHFPWQQLRVITLSVMVSPDEAYQLLSSATSAEVILLKLRRNPSTPVDSTPRPLATLPNLRFLEVRSDVGMYETLQHLDLPGLKILYLCGRRYHCDGPNIACKRYKDFISRAAVSLQFAMIDTFDFRGDDVAEFFNNPELLNIPVLQVTLDDDEARMKAEGALKLVFAATPNMPRRLRAQTTYWGSHLVGWVDGDVKEKYSTGFGYRRILAQLLELD
ncbi:hypothetical protein P691DRAFT_775673 [Macrolepiota fuliginosa MF-IS2]|uniref:F-box domain-containing protein n=1 Tax=Macrolepiota fuliginosa MF-IS2 TaxID=1400762 RepID=A0A9P5XB20_9AGAR|nr:hypothetical protein P691DRAFT_775673 [Macrolepiota fuliginosa MF-IS2]